MIHLYYPQKNKIFLWLWQKLEGVYYFLVNILELNMK